MGWIEVARAFASGTVSPVHHRFAHFRQRHLDADDGAKLGHERAHEQSDSAWAGEFCCRLAGVALAPMAGSLADRWDKRKILVATQIAQIIFAVALGFLVMSGHIQIWHIVFFALLLGIAFAYEMPAISVRLCRSW